MRKLLVKDLIFGYGKHEKKVIDNIYFSISQGTVIGLVGDNGTGKTTLMKLISGILEPNEGKILNEFKSVGILIEDPALYKDLKVIENLKFYCKLYGRDFQIIDEYKDLLGIGMFLKKKLQNFH